MIAYDLKCRAQGHRFEGWFASMNAYQEQRAKGWIACPHCGATDIEKMLSVPNVGSKSNHERQTVPMEVSNNDLPTSTITSPPTLPPAMREAMARIAEAQAIALKSSEWVGDAFPEMVRAQHYGEAEIRPIHGDATLKQARDLAEEGIAVMPIVFPITSPEKRN